MTKRCYRCGAPLYEIEEPAAPKQPRIKLTPTDRKVMKGVADGESDAEIAARLGRSRSTVTGHVQRVMCRLGARNRAHAIALLRDANLL